MAKIKIYKCCICHKTLDIKPIRLAKQQYNTQRYRQYTTVEHYDFCPNCYKIFNNWLKKHQK